MKLQPDAAQGPSITGYGPGWISINQDRLTYSVVLSSMGQRLPWNVQSYDALCSTDFDVFADWGAELILFGSGEYIRFPHPSWLQALYARRIGVETMDTQAACRTYNFLAAEGRKVVAALLL